MLETDLILAVLHHLLMFALLAILVMELMLARPGLRGAQLKRLAGLDLYYGAIAGLILAVGIARVFLGLKGPDYYFANIFFWLKIACFIMVATLSVPPTRLILAWRGKARQAADFSPSNAEIAMVRRYMHAEAVFFFLIPVFAALMARYS